MKRLFDVHHSPGGRCEVAMGETSPRVPSHDFSARYRRKIVVKYCHLCGGEPPWFLLDFPLQSVSRSLSSLPASLPRTRTIIPSRLWPRNQRAIALKLRTYTKGTLTALRRGINSASMPIPVKTTPTWRRAPEHRPLNPPRARSKVDKTHYVTSLQPKNARRWRADIWAIAFESLILRPP